MRINGWLFDAYPLDDKMIFWVKQENGKTIRLEDDSWSHSIYIAADYYYDKPDLLKSLLVKENQEDDDISCLIKDYEFVSRYGKITDSTESEVLKIRLSDLTKALTLAKKIEKLDKFGRLRLYNVDLLPAQSYFYEHDIFPLVFCDVYYNSSNAGCSKLSWNNKEQDDDVWSVDYQVPDFKTIHLNLNLKKNGKIPRYTDKIQSISIKQNNSEVFEIQSESEAEIICGLVKEVADIDPDFIFTDDGDSFTFPYLAYRAKENGIKKEGLVLSREQIPIKRPSKEGGISYFSYGRVYFRPTTAKLYGRIHLDKSNSFVWNESGLQGLYEIARICRMPLHTASRASIGKCLSSLQFYYATKKGILIPWKPTVAEHFKTLEQLLTADRGGFIFEPEIIAGAGVHENVAEFDFVSLYPNIMLQKNLSAETILCDCCSCRSSPNSSSNKLRVPELDYHVCQKRTGIVPTSLDIVLQKRAKYKQLLLSKTPTTIPEELETVYNSRQNSLKWILVTSFGYLGFNNAKFGRIDAHIAICAFARKILLQAAKIAERYGFTVLHGIVDSLWIKKKDNENTSSLKQKEEGKDDDYLALKELIEKETGFTVSFEGVYKWIAFTHSKTNNLLPVPNRYFGVFGDDNDKEEDGTSLKIRGLEARRHDTPLLFSKCQNEILKIMATGNNINEVKILMPKVTDTFQKYCQLLKEGKVPLEELVFTKRLSKNSNEYLTRNTIENDALAQLAMEGKHLKAGQILKYIITDFYYNSKKYSKNNDKRRTIPIELINEKTTTNTIYDVKRYTELLAETCNSVTEPFGYTLTTTKQADSVN